MATPSHSRAKPVGASPKDEAEREMTAIERRGYEPGTSALPEDGRQAGRDGGGRRGHHAEDHDAAVPDQKGSRLREAREAGLLPEPDAPGPPQDAPSETPPGTGGVGGPGR